MKLTPTDEQQAIIDSTEKTSENLMVQAYAGAAKTTSLEMLSQKIKTPSLALAFNKSIKTEMAKRMSSIVTVQTLNGLGHSSIMRALPGVSFRLEDKKLGKLVSEVMKQFSWEGAEEDWDLVRSIASQAMQRGIVPGDKGAMPLTLDSPEEWREIASAIGAPTDYVEALIDMAREVVEQNISLARQGIISFDDQLYFSLAVLGAKGYPKFPFVLVDEAQDLSPLNHAMIGQAIRPGGRFIVVGDPCQAIYAFRGADSDSMKRLAALRPSWLRLPLATTFRCPKIVVARNVEHAPGFNAFHSNPEGEFISFPPGSEWSIYDLMDLNPDGAPMAILCRNNAPLVSLAFKLLRRRIPVNMLGRDIGQGMTALSRKLFPDGMERASMIRVLDDWQLSETSSLMANGKEEQAERVDDQAESLKALLDFPETTDGRSLRGEIKKLFAPSSERGSSITLSTIHRAKGLEWDLVVNLDPWRIPSKFAKRAAQQGDDTQLRQELNLKYVLETRTKRVLVNADIGDFK